jgi:hypothetical protein
MLFSSDSSHCFNVRAREVTALEQQRQNNLEQRGDAMTVLKYKDFQGSVSFEDGRLFIQILHIDDRIAADCDSASKVEQTFRELVDDYLETCAATGKSPCPFERR